MILPEIAAYLASEGVGTLQADLFLGDLPDAPDTCVALFEYGGLPPMRTHAPAGIAQEQPRVQVLVRSASYQAGRTKIEDAYRALAAVKNSALSGTNYLSIEPLQSPFFLERDENDRPKFAFNCQVVKELS